MFGNTQCFHFSGYIVSDLGRVWVIVRCSHYNQYIYARIYSKSDICTIKSILIYDFGWERPSVFISLATVHCERFGMFCVIVRDKILISRSLENSFIYSFVHLFISLIIGKGHISILCPSHLGNYRSYFSKTRLNMQKTHPCDFVEAVVNK